MSQRLFLIIFATYKIYCKKNIKIVTIEHRVHYADQLEASFNPNANRRELCNIPNTDPPTPYRSLVAQGTRVGYRFNEYVVCHRLISSFAYDYYDDND